MVGLDKKHIFGMVKVGEKGQIVIPKEARDLFGIKPKDQLMLIGDEETGLAIITSDKLNTFFQTILTANSGKKAEE